MVLKLRRSRIFSGIQPSTVLHLEVIRYVIKTVDLAGSTLDVIGKNDQSRMISRFQVVAPKWIWIRMKYINGPHSTKKNKKRKVDEYWGIINLIYNHNLRIWITKL